MIFPTRTILCKALLALGLVVISHQLSWDGLRFATSEAVLRVCSFLGMSTERKSFDTISVKGEIFCFVTSCTFIDVFAGVGPLIWNCKKSLSRNCCTILIASVGLFTLNVVRLALGQVLYARGAPWVFAHSMISGFTYFAVWLLVSPAKIEMPFGSNGQAPLTKLGKSAKSQPRKYGGE
jgi:exosortase/archaeosortase